MMFESLQLLPTPPEDSLIYEVSYSPLLVLVSISLAVFASYAALMAAARIPHPQNALSRLLWIGVATLTLGVGIWAMHFIGMLAISLPCGIHYDPYITLLSMIPGILASLVPFGVVWHHGEKHLPPWLASVLLGAGIGTMHYTGMAAMHLDGFIRYDRGLFAVSIVVAVILSYAALYVKERTELSGWRRTAKVAFVTGCAISAMHYTALTATYFVRGVADTEAVFFTTTMLAILVAVTTVILALAALAVATISRNREIVGQLSQSEQRILALLDSMAEGAYGVDLDGRCTFVNQSFLHILGYESAGEILGRNIHELIHHAHADGTPYPESECRMYQAFLRKEGTHVVDEVFWRKDGRAIPVEYWSQPIFIDEEIRGAIATFVDITERKQAMAALRESEERFRQMFERHSAVMLLIEPQSGMIVDANPAAEVFYGYPLAVLRGMGIGRISILPGVDIDRAMRAAIAQEQNYFVFEHRLAGGEVRAVEVHASPIEFKGRPLLFAIVHDITERALEEAQMRNLAFHDALTQLPNRRLLSDRLKQEIASCKRNGQYAALMFLDLDNFKPLNDTHGHKVGDLLLIEVAQRIGGCVRETDTVARFGGDEFVVLLGELDGDAGESAGRAVGIAEKIRMSLAEPYRLKIIDENGDDSVVEHRSAASIGVAVFGYPVDVEELFKRGDLAMYEAKNAGRNRVVVKVLASAGQAPAMMKPSILRLNWHESYACGNPTIDGEHYRLFELANALIDAAFSREEHPREFEEALDTLLAHVVQHFADEEALLEQHHYAGLEAHIRAHGMLLKSANELRDAVAAGGGTIGDLVYFLAEEVIAQHMFRVDRDYYSLFE